MTDIPEIIAIQPGKMAISGKGINLTMAFLFFVGMARFELAAPRPPDVYSNLTELHPDDSMGVGVCTYYYQRGKFNKF